MQVMLIPIIYQHSEVDTIFIWLKIAIRTQQVMPTLTIHMIAKEELEMI